ncbi:uncharacterized protein [Branchiostoma lanceolatum]|uniref:uncharacterized protein n=1 Tax=Branchiostoma lanceolatum TaxID=7740 RepID=UPI003455AB29
MTTDANKEILGMKSTVFGLLKTVQKNMTELNTISGALGSLMGRTKRLKAGRARGRAARKGTTKAGPVVASNKTAVKGGNSNVGSTDGPAGDKVAEMKRMTEEMNEWMRKVEEETKRLEKENTLMSQQLSKIAVQP